VTSLYTEYDAPKGYRLANEQCNVFYRAVRNNVTDANANGAARREGEGMRVGSDREEGLGMDRQGERCASTG
jgi:hypothetical protein